MADLQSLQARVEQENLADSVGAMAVYPLSPSLQKALTLRTRTDEILALATERGDYTLVPRGLSPGAHVDRRVIGQKLNLHSIVKMRDAEQTKVRDKAGKLLDAGESFILEAGTGTGKTVIACDLIARINRKTLVIVPKSDLYNQWARELKKFLPGVKIGFIRQNKYDVAGKDVVIGMLHSLADAQKYPDSLRKEFGFVIWDEVHRVPAETFSRTAGMFYGRLRMGLSATPNRFDGKEILIQAHIGPVRVQSKQVKMSPLVGIYRTPWRCPRDRHGQRLRHTATRAGHILSHLARHEGRTALILKRVAAAHAAGRKTVVFSDRVEHLKLMQLCIPKLGVPLHDTALYISATKKADLEKAKTKPVIFATYGMMAEGTDIPWLDCVVLATPRSNIKQPVGRVLREHPDKPRPVVLDFVDRDSPLYAAWARRRELIYAELGATVKYC